MRQVIGYLLFGLLLAVTFVAAQADLFVNIWQGLKSVFKLILVHDFRRHPRPVQRFDVVAARRESHALGLPFPESDGTLSKPPEHVTMGEAIADHELDLTYEALYGKHLGQ